MKLRRSEGEGQRSSAGLGQSVNPRSPATTLGGENGALDRLRKGDRAEECLRVEIVLAGFVDNPQQIVRLGGCITEGHVDFAPLERRRVAIVLDAYHQLS